MSNPSPTPQVAALKGWRARAWAWVLFAALLKGLIPHAALASAVMNGDPALVWCAPGTPAAGSAEELAGGMSAASHSCVCASAGDGALPFLPHTVPNTVAGHDQQQAVEHLAAVTQKLLPPPARGPPSL